jgi:DNA-directed RNA polymerase specialized sigma24 family protein
MGAREEEQEELAVRAAAGDRAALESLLALIQPNVLRRCARFLPCYQDAEEACQDVLLQVARNIGSFQGRSKFSTWLHVIIANGSRQVVDARTTSVIAGSRLDLLDALEQLEGRKAELVAPMVLRDICQLDYKEIALHLGIPEGTVKSRIHQARGHVREYLLAGLQ